ncbi:hypothetical protein D9Q98_004073 [Chlorella vulgaris]|uniref:Uncharacterized protein n=1 Tax=Chlorella vulgaris TaxID=3077 RepID=A0A9D4TR97_CHLVU|nr:hypothetical protein D9Q98_004073 [Chlorella vulgaris]
MKKDLTRLPKLRNVRRNGSDVWTGGNSTSIQDRRRGKTVGRYANDDDRMLAFLMQSAIKAPRVPLHVDPGMSLYRGVKAAEVPKVGDTVTDPGYSAFSRNEAFAIHHILHGLGRHGDKVRVLYVLHARDVVKGTPWIWFADFNEMRGESTINDTWHYSSFPFEKEVLLPPGTFTVKSVIRRETQFRNQSYPYHEVHVTFRPDVTATATRQYKGKNVMLIKKPLRKGYDTNEYDYTAYGRLFENGTNATVAGPRDAKGRAFLMGARGGVYVLDARGKRQRPAVGDSAQRQRVRHR